MRRLLTNELIPLGLFASVAIIFVIDWITRKIGGRNLWAELDQYEQVEVAIPLRPARGRPYDWQRDG